MSTDPLRAKLDEPCSIGNTYSGVDRTVALNALRAVLDVLDEAQADVDSKRIPATQTVIDVIHVRLAAALGVTGD